MRILLGIVLVLTMLLTLWCAAGYFIAPAQQSETRAELEQSRATRQALSEADISIHVSGVGRQGRNWGIAAVLSGSATLASAASLILASKVKAT